MTTYKIVIADNHSIFRAGLKIVLETTGDFVVIGEASNGREAVESCQTHQPDVVLMDVHMPNGNGIEATEVLHQLFPKLIIIGVSAFSFEVMQQGMLRAGAIGFISKEVDFAEIIERIFSLIAMTHNLRCPLPEIASLTNMEQKVLALLAAGDDRKRIAEYLGISYNTVKMHCRHLYRKLKVSTAQEAIQIAFQRGLLS
ncbi:MAG: response regulator transcription factor [Anaerolineae bacterium]